MAQIDTSTHPLEHDGWREGRPVEDPAKTKRWGVVTAKPSEYLVHVRRGRLRRRSSGQGASCFKLPWDSVAVVPTSLQRLAFRADQVTREKVGVEVSGLAVYRIVEPLIAYRVLNFSYPERAQQKLEQTLSEMCVGATRRLVANLGVVECLQKRKAALADELLREIAPVIGGAGSIEDWSGKGWGVVLDTIEIQEVRVLSTTVFGAMQAPFRAELERAAREVRTEADRAVRTREAAAGREVELARISAVAAVREHQNELERRATEARTQDVVFRRELEMREAQAELDAHAVLSLALERRAELEHAELEASIARRRAEAEVSRLEGQTRAEVALAAARAEREMLEGKARYAIAERLPDLAAAVGERVGEVKVVQIGGGDTAFGSIAQAVRAVVELAKSA